LTNGGRAFNVEDDLDDQEQCHELESGFNLLRAFARPFGNGGGRCLQMEGC
jgi:hypothetical protein